MLFLSPHDDIDTINDDVDIICIVRTLRTPSSVIYLLVTTTTTVVVVLVLVASGIIPIMFF